MRKDKPINNIQLQGATWDSQEDVGRSPFMLMRQGQDAILTNDEFLMLMICS